MTEKKEMPIQIYTSHDGSIQLNVQLEKETIWLSEEQMAALFGIDRSVIGKHIRKIIKTKELSLAWVRAFFAHTAKDAKTYRVGFYNLDMIISVGYRVNSQKATHFRQRATKVLKEYLIQWYALNNSRLQQTGFAELQRALELIKDTLDTNSLSHAATQGLLEVITRYTQSRLLLHQYDQWELSSKWKTIIHDHKLDAQQASEALEALKSALMQEWTASDLFALPKYAGTLEGIFGNIYQSFNKKDLYPSVEEKAAHLLYFIIKDHPFNDGNKRSAAFLFIIFLQKYEILHDKKWTTKINDKGLVALALLIAQSNPKDKELMIQLVINLINE